MASCHRVFYFWLNVAKLAKNIFQMANMCVCVFVCFFLMFFRFVATKFTLILVKNSQIFVTKMEIIILID